MEQLLVKQADLSISTGHRTPDERVGRMRDFCARLVQMVEEDGLHELCKRSQFSLYAFVLEGICTIK